MKVKKRVSNNNVELKVLSTKMKSLKPKKVKCSSIKEKKNVLHLGLKSDTFKGKKFKKLSRLGTKENNVALGGRSHNLETSLSLNSQTADGPKFTPLLQSQGINQNTSIKETKCFKENQTGVQERLKITSPMLKADPKPRTKRLLKRVQKSGKVELQMMSLLKLNKVSEAVTSLMELLKKSENKFELLDLVVPVFLQVECIKIPICPTKQLRFKLPHPLVNGLSDILLITADKKGAKIYPEKAVEYYTDLLARHGIDFIQKVMPLRTLKHEYSQYEMRKKLVDQFDVILADACIVKSLPRLLGKFICYKRKMPIAVHLNRKHLKEHLQMSLAKTQMTIKSSGHTSSVQVGHLKMSASEIARNIVEIGKQLTQVYSGGWENIRSLYLKTSKSPPLPIYLSLLSPNIVKIPVEQVKKRAPVEDELSTMMGSNVVVRPDGTVYLRNIVEDNLDASHDDEILQEAEKYIQTSKTVHYGDSDDGSDMEANAVTVAAEQDLLNKLDNFVRTKKEHVLMEEEDDETNGEESSDLEDITVSASTKKQKIGHARKPLKKSCNEKPQHYRNKILQEEKCKGFSKPMHGSGVVKPELKGRSQRRGSRGGKKNKTSKEQRKAFIKRKKAEKNIKK